MSDSPQSDAPPRRRTIAAVPARRPFAVVGQPSEELRALVLEYGPCVPFPTITHFRGAERERWAGVLILRASAWDAALDTATRGRSSVALFDVVLAHPWPDDIVRISDDVELRAWLEGARLRLEPTVRLPARGSEPLVHASRIHAGPDAISSVAPVADTRTYARPRSELLVVAQAPERRAQLFRALRGARPVRVIAELSELTTEDHDSGRWLGVVIADGSASPALVSGLARAECVVLRIAEGEAFDEPALKRWLLLAVAFEYVNHAGVAQVIADAFAEAEESAYPPSVELAALYASTLSASQRSLALDMTEHTWRWYAKESTRILGESNKVLAARALTEAGCEGLLPPSPWLTRDEVTDSKPWSSLRARVPQDVLRAPLSRVPWSESKVADLIRVSRERGVQTVDALLSLSSDAIGSQWESQRVCDGLQEALLATLPFASTLLPDQAVSFARMRDSLLAAMPSEDAALPLRWTSGAQRVVGLTQRALRFHEALLRDLHDRLKRLLETPLSLEELQRRDPFFADVASLIELQHFARAALRLPLFVSKEHNGTSSIAATRSLRSIHTARPEFAELRGVNMDDGDPEPMLPRLKTPESAQAPSVAPSVKASERVGVSSAAPSAKAAKVARTSREVPGVKRDLERDLVEAERVLRQAGKPASRVELISMLGERAAPTLYRMAGARPFVELDASNWGLIDRDVPGGDPAFDAAVAMLRETGAYRGAVSHAIEGAVRELSHVHHAWTRAMVVAALRYART